MSWNSKDVGAPPEAGHGGFQRFRNDRSAFENCPRGRGLSLTVLEFLATHLRKPLRKDMASNIVLAPAENCVARQPSEIRPLLRRRREPDLATPFVFRFVSHVAPPLRES